MPKVSLIIPIYNVVKYLPRCVESIVNQTFKDFEAVFVNDGSTDDSPIVCQNLISSYPNMKLVNKINGGLSSARLYGFHESCGEYIVFIDSDDYLHTDYLKELYYSIVSNNADVSMCSYFLDTQRELITNALYFPFIYGHLSKNDILKKYLLPQLSSSRPGEDLLPSFMWLRMFKRNLLSDEYFISERIVYQEDLAFSMKIFPKIRKLAIVNKPLYYYCVNPGSLTMKYRPNLWGMMSSLFKLVKDTVNQYDFSISRLDGFLLYMIMFSLRNASIAGLKTFNSTEKFIQNDEDVKKMIDRLHFSSLSGKNKLLYILIKCNLLKILYFKCKMSNI